MGIYISSKGEEKDTGTMAYSYLVNALAKAQENGDEANVKVLQDEITSRDSQNSPSGTDGVEN